MRIQLSNFSGKSKKDSLASKIFATLFLSFFAAGGTFFAIMLTRALIKGEAPWYLAFFLIIPGIFMLVGFGGIWGVWFAKKEIRRRCPKPPIKKQANGRPFCSGWCLS